MIYRKMDKMGISPSLLGFGCMRFPRNADGSINEPYAEQMIDHALKSGINYLDTGYAYHEGRSEKFLGKVLKKYPRDSYILTTKLPTWAVNSVEDASRFFEKQLGRLGTDHLDFYLLHALDRERWERMKDCGALDFCIKLKEEGRIKGLGFSFHDSYDVFEEILRYYPWDLCQIQLNYMDIDHQAGLKGYHLAEELDIPVVVMEPIKGGSLSTLPEDIFTKLQQEAPDRSAAAWALKWIQCLPNVKVILSGMSTDAQLEENLATFSGDSEGLTQREKIALQQAAQELRARVQNGCTQCAYCMPCPVGVDIPNNFRFWNEYHIYGNDAAMHWQWTSMIDESEKGHNCIKCGKCEDACPQHISIREDLERVTADFKKFK